MSHPKPLPQPTPAPAVPAVGRRVARPRELDSGTLFGPDTEVLIRHDDTLYRLRKTGQGKLILTK
jgi:hemin uptake protein HemP